MRPTPSRQRDLFEEDKPTAQVPTTLTVTLVRRIGELLVEAIGDSSVKPRTACAAITALQPTVKASGGRSPLTRLPQHCRSVRRACGNSFRMASSPRIGFARGRPG